MRVAALYDIHGNLPALEAVIRDMHDARVDHVVVGGDVLPGPMPRETLTGLLDLRIPLEFLSGNGETAVLAELAGTPIARLPEAAREVVRWTAEQLHPQEELFLRSWPATLRLDIPGVGSVLFCHATPRNDTDIFTRLTPDDRLAPVFEGVDAAVVVCGHTHMQFDRTVGAVRIVNAGSIGMPFGEPGAYWLLLGPDIELRFTTYDLAAAADRIRATSYPQADDFIENNLLHPQSEARMLEAFGRVELA